MNNNDPIALKKKVLDYIASYSPKYDAFHTVISNVEIEVDGNVATIMPSATIQPEGTDLMYTAGVSRDELLRICKDSKEAIDGMLKDALEIKEINSSMMM